MLTEYLELNATMNRISKTIIKYEDLIWYYETKRSESLSRAFKSDIDDIERKYPGECEDILELPDVKFESGLLAGMTLAKRVLDHGNGRSSQSFDEMFNTVLFTSPRIRHRFQ